MYKPENVFWDTYRYDGTKMGKTKNAVCSSLLPPIANLSLL